MATPNSTNMAVFARPLILLTSQKVLQTLGDSINTSVTTLGMVLGYRDALPLKWNGWTCQGAGSTSDIGYTNGAVTGFVSAATDRYPSQTNPSSGTTTYSGGQSGISPVPGRDFTFTGTMTGGTKYSSSALVQANQKWLRTINYLQSGSAYPLSHRVMFYDGTDIAPSISFIASRTTTGVNQTIYTKTSPTNTITYRDVGTTWVNTDGVTSGSSGGGSPGVGDPDTESRGNGSTAVLNTADKHYHFGSRYRVGGSTIGVHWNEPISFGGWRTVDHLDTTFFTDAALAQWYAASDIPTHIILWIGQNLTTQQSTELNAGTYKGSAASYKEQLVSIIARHDAAIATAGGTAPKYLLITQYRTGYNQIVYDSMAQAQYEIALANPTQVAHFNLYQAAGGQGVDLTPPGYLADTVHPSDAGKLYFAGLIYQAMIGSVTSTGRGSGASRSARAYRL